LIGLPGLEIERLTAIINYRFSEKKLLIQALTHASYVNEHPDKGLSDNERLEFLGDAVLDLVIGDLLFRHFHNADEGLMSKYRAALVDEKGLARQAQKLRLGEFLLLGRGEEQGGGRQKPSILAGAFEALAGAIYLDGGWDSAYGWVSRLFWEEIQGVERLLKSVDFKTSLQELTQAEFRCLPDYVVLEEEGPPHDRTYRVGLFLKGRLMATGIGRSKKEAEQNAAREAFSCLRQGGRI
jgi:ribonuclease III